MLTQRLKGLANLHLALSTSLVLLLFVAQVQAEPWIPAVTISPDLSLAPYLLCVFLGMVLSARFVQQAADNFLRVSWPASAWLATRQVALIAGVIFAFMFAFKDRSMSRLFIGTYLVAAWWFLLVLNHALPKFFARIFFLNARRIPTLVVGSLGALERMRGWLNRKQALGIDPVGFLSFNGHEVPAETSPPFAGRLQALPQAVADRGVLQVMLLELPPSAAEGRFILETCQDAGCRLLIFSNLADQLQHPLVTVEEQGLQFYSLQAEPLEDPLHRVLKRVLDVAVALPFVVLVLPVLFVWVAVMQRLQAPGPVLFGQERSGHNRQPFRVLKFRTMRVDNPDEARQASAGDDRIYPFGRFLRRTSLDEFPQFWNVLKGEMSVVGPRPHMLAHDDQFAAQLRTYRTRFFVKPGITGLAQCAGYRGEITDPTLLQRRVELDLKYIREWSIWLDLLLILKTAWHVLFPPKTAY